MINPGRRSAAISRGNQLATTFPLDGSPPEHERRVMSLLSMLLRDMT
jgi:hypothetical protein